MKILGLTLIMLTFSTIAFGGCGTTSSSVAGTYKYRDDYVLLGADGTFQTASGINGVYQVSPAVSVITNNGTLATKTQISGISRKILIP